MRAPIPTARCIQSLDGVLAYGERTAGLGRGYFMMDSPGNDLESIAGQVRAYVKGGKIALRTHFNS